MGKCLFITGTGTDVGKTYITALIIKKLRDSGRNAGYYKAAISGAEKDNFGKLLPGDAVYVNEFSNLNEDISRLVSYVYLEAVSPHLAANLNNRQISLKKIEHDFLTAANRHDFLTMEGSGGIICPLRWDSEKHLGLDDLVKYLGLSVLIVASAGLGTINSAVLTVEYLKSRNIPIKGFVLNQFHFGNIMEEDNKIMIEEMTKIPVIAVVQENDKELDINADFLAGLYDDIQKEI